MNNETLSCEAPVMWSERQAERIESAGIPRPDSGSCRTSFDGIPIELRPSAAGSAVEVSAGPLATVRGEPRAAVRAYLMHVNAFVVKDGLFEIADDGAVVFRLEADDESSEDGGVGSAVWVAGSTASRFSEPARALAAGLLSLEQACRTV